MVLHAVCCLGGCKGSCIWSNPYLVSYLGHYAVFLPAVCGGGTGEIWMVFWVLLKHLEVSRPSNHLTDGTWAVWDA